MSSKGKKMEGENIDGKKLLRFSRVKLAEDD